MRYTYYCPECGQEIDKDEKMSEHGTIEYACPTCGHQMESKITGGSGFSLQGDGWGNQGYGSHGYSNG